jgi:hypothetical protein
VPAGVVVGWSVLGAVVGIFVIGLQWLCTAPATRVPLPTPRSTHRAERAATVAFLAAYGVGASTLAVAWTGLLAGPEWAFAVALIAPIIGLALHRGGAGVSPWLLFAAQRTALALRGRLPWRLLGFLDAHRAGLLRRADGMYEMHPTIRRHLRR